MAIMDRMERDRLVNGLHPRIMDIIRAIDRIERHRLGANGHASNPTPGSLLSNLLCARDAYLDMMEQDR